MAFETHTPVDRTFPLPAGQPDTRLEPIGRASQATWNDATATSVKSGQQLLGGLGLADFQLASAPLPVRAAERRPRPHSAQRQVDFRWDNPNPPTFDWVEPTKPGLPAARDSLTRVADSALTPEQATAFRANMRLFEQRATIDHLSNSEVQATYEATERLLKAKSGAASVENMHRLASQIMEEAANPNKARTGHATGSCGPVGLEAITYQRNPSAAAELITQSAITGTYHAQNGLTVPADITPTYESKHPDKYSQNYASQIFQSVSLNAGLMDMGDEHTFHLKYGKVKPGEGAYFLDGQGRRDNFDGTSPELLLAAYHALTGKQDLAIILGGKGIDTDNIKFVNSPADLQRTIARLAENGTPTVIGVDARNQPLWTQNGGSPTGETDPQGNFNHFISLKGYNADLGAITFRNGWDDDNHQISPKDLFRATRQVDQNLPDMGREFVGSLNDGHGNYAEAIDALRIRTETGRISNADLNRLITRDIQGLINQRGKHFMDDQTDAGNILEIMNYLQNRNALSMPPHMLALVNCYIRKHKDD